MSLNSSSPAQTCEFLIAEINGQAVGIANFSVLPDRSAWLETLRVIPEFQGQGVGKRFYERFFEIARQKKIKTMRMYTGLTNHASKGLAERYGFFSRSRISGSPPVPKRCPAAARWSVFLPTS